MTQQINILNNKKIKGAHHHIICQHIVLFVLLTLNHKSYKIIKKKIKQVFFLFKTKNCNLIFELKQRKKLNKIKYTLNL